MTNEEMAAALRTAGWRVQEPITKENCRHPRIQGAFGISSDGSGYQNGRCLDCGYEYDRKWGPDPNYKPSDFLVQN